MNASEIANQIVARLDAERPRLQTQYSETESEIGCFWVDDLLPADLAQRLFDVFPAQMEMHSKSSLRERKSVTAQMDQHAELLEKALFAFQDKRVVSLIESICGIDKLYPDPNLYAGGLSLMQQGDFLNPHLDNSHDKDRNRWRALNLLYYITPEWPEHVGGNLEVWPQGLSEPPVEIHSRFNRLVVLATHQQSWHSVNPIQLANNPRCCISNYFFADQPIRKSDEFHVTSFRGRPEQPLRDRVLRGDA